MMKKRVEGKLERPIPIWSSAIVELPRTREEPKGILEGGTLGICFEE